MVHLIPHSEVRITSKKTPEDIYMILNSVTDTRKIMFDVDAEFAGRVHPLDFKIYPVYPFMRNSFLPTLTGKITEGEGETVIDINAKIDIFTRILVVFGSGVAGFVFLCGIIDVIISGFEEVGLVLAPLGYITFMQILMRCGFYGPTRKALKRLKELLC